MRAALFTLGCKLNQYETFYIKERLSERGFEIVPPDEKADLYIVNSCAVTKKSDYHSRQAVRKFVRRNPDALVIVTGCSVEINPESFRKIAGVDFILGNSQKYNITGFLGEAGKERAKREEPCVCIKSDGDPKISMFINNFHEYTRAFIKVQEGCNAACSYCIVPQARGKCRSIPAPEVIDQTVTLIANGYKEIVLTGTHLGQYGQDLSDNITLSDLLSDIIQLPGLGRVRLSSIEPQEFTPFLIDILNHSRKICTHLHIPLQSGDDAILKQMGRDYSTHYYEELINKLALHTSCAIGADVIVGFPAESDESFERTYNFIDNLPLAYLHVFSYSPRPNTKACSMNNQVPGEVKRRRSKKLRALSVKKKNEFWSRFLMKDLIALVLHKDGYERGSKIALTDNYIPVSLQYPGIEALLNHFVRVKIISFNGDEVKGEILEIMD
ncbi:MAG: tRNA (N(6)-L-threonylcarbamoyladenosine(37)-C(2))-methylthiotransferase MtaB [bacterium]